MLDVWGRKSLLFYSMLVATLFALLFAFVSGEYLPSPPAFNPPHVRHIQSMPGQKHQAVAIVSFAMVFNAATISAWNSINCLSTECFPTAVRCVAVMWTPCTSSHPMCGFAQGYCAGFSICMWKGGIDRRPVREWHPPVKCRAVVGGHSHHHAYWSLCIQVSSARVCTTLDWVIVCLAYVLYLRVDHIKEPRITAPVKFECSPSPSEMLALAWPLLFIPAAEIRADPRARRQNHRLWAGGIFQEAKCHHAAP